jgi:HEPN domain-containing protein
MKPLDDPEVAAWLEKASGDMRMARYAARSDVGLWDQACYHSQQAAEKVLKAALVAVGSPVPHTHSLLFLLRSLLPDLPNLACLIDPAAVLSAFATAPRYPSFLAPETEAQACAALRHAEEILDTIRSEMA